MSEKQTIKCVCGQRILAKDVMQTGCYLRLNGTSLIYIKYRCSKCKRLGEQFVKQSDWDDSVLYENSADDITPDERVKICKLGRIDVGECIDTHFELEKINRIDELLEVLSDKKEL